MGIVNYVAQILGTIINFIYKIVPNYALAYIIFTFVIKLLTFYMTYAQRRDSIKQTVISEKTKEIQEKYANDREKQSMELMNLYRKEKVNPLNSCLFFIVTIITIFAMLKVANQPLTYIKKVKPEVINEYFSKIEKKIEEESKQDDNISVNLTEKNDANKNKNNNENEQNSSIVRTETEEKTKKEKKNALRFSNKEIQVIKHFGKENPDLHIDMNFLGIDLSDIPSQNLNFSNLNNIFTLNSLKVLILPAIFIIISVIFTQISFKSMEALQKTQKAEDKKFVKTKYKFTDGTENSENPELEKEETMQDALMQTNKNMMYITPLILLWVSLNSTLSLTLYFISERVMDIISFYIINKLLEKEGLIGNKKLNPGE